MPQLLKTKKFTLAAITAAMAATLAIVLLFSADNNVNRANLEFIASYGWRADEKPTEIAHLTIPEEFDVVYETYNHLEKEAGFDLTSHKGIRVTRYSYRILNHRESDSGLIRANLFVSKDGIVAADICSLALDGFMIPINDTSDLIDTP